MKLRIDNRTFVAYRSEVDGAPPSRPSARVSLACLYFLAGLLHIARPDMLLLITPRWVPFPNTVIYVTGILEILGAVALLTSKLRQVAGMAFALYAICVYPANIKHAIDGLSAPHGVLGWWYHLPRLALQPVIVWWALFAGGVIHWPRKRNIGGSKGAV